MRLYQTRIRKTTTEKRPTKSPLKPFTVRLNCKLLQLKGCMSVLQGMCTEMGMPSAKDVLVQWQNSIEYRLREAYQVEKQRLIDQGLYPAIGGYDQNKIDSKERREQDGI